MDLVKNDGAPNPNAPSPISVVDALKRDGRRFDHGLFLQRLQALRSEVVETGGMHFIPLVWGRPNPTDYLSQDNVLEVNYQDEALVTYEKQTLRDPKPAMGQIGEVTVRLQGYSIPDPMTNQDVTDRVRMVRNFERLRFPTKVKRFNQMNGITALTDDQGNMSVSLDAAMPLSVSQESGYVGDSNLAVPYPEEGITTRIFYAAYLRAMGCDNNTVYQAAGGKLREVEQGVYKSDDPNFIHMCLRSVPSLEDYYHLDEARGEFIFRPPEGSSFTEADVYRNILTSAHFQDDGNIGFTPFPKNLQEVPSP